MIGITITAIICGTLLALAAIGAWSNYQQRNAIANKIFKNFDKKL